MATVLLVEDDLVLRATMADVLRDEGHTVHAATNGAAIPLVLAARPDVILLDIWMAGMDGVEVSRRLKADPRTAAIPIVACSAHDRLRDLGMHADDYLPKPFELRDLLAMVDRWTADKK